jgi:hypothetical protein
MDHPASYETLDQKWEKRGRRREGGWEDKAHSLTSLDLPQNFQDPAPSSLEGGRRDRE